MHTSEYLYGIDPSTFAEMPYREAIEFKIKQTKLVIHELLEIDFMIRDDERLHAVIKAQSFNNELLDELDNRHIIKPTK